MTAPRAAAHAEACMGPHSEPLFGAYLHYPYCRTRCHYCAFNTYLVHGEETLADYGKALAQEIGDVSRREGLAGRTLHSVFCGGGTPTVFPEKALTQALARLKDLYAVAKDAEVTFEANPGTVDARTLEALRAAGFTRISLGAQAYQPHLLHRLGRTHDSSDVEQAVALARAAGFAYVSIDLMYGLPGQTIEDVRESTAWALSLGLRHLSAYGLEVEPSTRFGAEARAGTLILPDDAVTVAMGEAIDAMTAARGLERYEVSNYAVPGHESRHNMLYWLRGEYRGFGPGAHSFVGDRRFWNLNDPRAYVRRVRSGQSLVAGDEHLSFAQAMGEWVYLRLRLRRGASLAAFRETFGASLPDVFAEQVRDLTAQGLLETVDGHVRTTAQGRWLLNRVVLPFLQP